MKRLLLVMGLALLGIPLTFGMTFGEDTEGVNYHFSHQDGSGTKSSASYNPQAEGDGWSRTYDSGNVQNADGSWTFKFGSENGISIRTAPAWGDD